MALLQKGRHRVKVWELTRGRFKASARDLCAAAVAAAATDLQAGALIRERWAEEGRHDAHHRLGHVALQDGVGVLAVAGVVADLENTEMTAKTTTSSSFLVSFLKTSSCWRGLGGAGKGHSPCRYQPGSSQRASTCGWRCRSPSSPPPCPRSSGSRSWCRRSSPETSTRSFGLITLFRSRLILADVLTKLKGLRRQPSNDSLEPPKSTSSP